MKKYSIFYKENNKEYPICPRCFNKSVAGAHMTSDGKRSIYCTSGSCNYDVPFETLTTPVGFKHINPIIARIIKSLTP